MKKQRDRAHEDEERTKKKPGGQQHQNPPGKTGTDNPERNPRDQKGGVEANSRGRNLLTHQDVGGIRSH
jgi:hypothetical protein